MTDSPARLSKFQRCRSGGIPAKWHFLADARFEAEALRCGALHALCKLLRNPDAVKGLAAKTQVDCVSSSIGTDNLEKMLTKSMGQARRSFAGLLEPAESQQALKAQQPKDAVLFILFVNTMTLIFWPKLSFERSRAKEYINTRHYSYFQQVADIEVPELWSRVEQPVLVVAGASDYVAPQAHQEAVFDFLLKRPGGSLSTFMIAPIDHKFHSVHNATDSYRCKYEAPFCYETVHNIATWIRERCNQNSQ